MLTPTQVLDQAFLDVRSMLLEIAACLDRLDDARKRFEPSGEQTLPEDPRLTKIFQSLRILADRFTPPYRVEKLLELFSVPVDD